MLKLKSNTPAKNTDTTESNSKMSFVKRTPKKKYNTPTINRNTTTPNNNTTEDSNEELSDMLALIASIRNEENNLHSKKTTNKQNQTNNNNDTTYAPQSNRENTNSNMNNNTNNNTNNSNRMNSNTNNSSTNNNTNNSNRMNSNTNTSSMGNSSMNSKYSDSVSESDTMDEYESDTMDKHIHNCQYTPEEVEYIVSVANRKALTDKIKSLQKPEWIEIYRIVKNNEVKHFQENNSGIWIVMNKLQNDTIIKMHRFTEYCIGNREKLENDKTQRNRIRDKIKKGQIKNDDELIRTSKLLNDEDESHIKSFVDQTSTSGLDGDRESNLKVQVNLSDAQPLRQHETDELLHKYLMSRMKDDVQYHHYE
jgi:hypothetical protein